ncbi:hypothetical protein bcgnr5371_08590 [Bacillus cereus]
MFVEWNDGGLYEETVWQVSRDYRRNGVTSRMRKFYEECERKRSL